MPFLPPLRTQPGPLYNPQQQPPRPPMLGGIGSAIPSFLMAMGSAIAADDPRAGVGVIPAYAEKQRGRREQNKTLGWLRAKHPEIAAQVDQGMPLPVAMQLATKGGEKRRMFQDPAGFTRYEDDGSLVPGQDQYVGGGSVGSDPMGGAKLPMTPKTAPYHRLLMEMDEKKREQEEAESASAQRNATTARAADVVLGDIGRLKSLASDGKTPVSGFGAQSLSNIPGTASSDAKQLLNTVKANIGFDRLQAMREASPTGGALGQVSEMELTYLQSTLGSLEQSQSEEQFLRNLERVEQIYVQIMKKASAYPNAAQFGFAGGDASPASPQGGWQIEEVQ